MTPNAPMTIPAIGPAPREDPDEGGADEFVGDDPDLEEEDDSFSSSPLGTFVLSAGRMLSVLVMVTRGVVTSMIVVISPFSAVLRLVIVLVVRVVLRRY